VNPDIVTGVSLMILFVFIGIPLGKTSLLLSHISFNIPYVIISVLPKLSQFNNNMYEAALDLGASPLKAYSKIVVPEIMPGIMTGFLLALTLSIDDFVVSFFTAGAGATNLSIFIYSAVSKRYNPSINALSTLMFVTIFILLLIVNFRTKKKDTIN
jgi:spermidine/putrescine transport system permease protein